MSKSIDEDIAGAIFDEYSVRDTVGMSVREHSMTVRSAVSYLRSSFLAGKVKFYRDEHVGEAHRFVDVDTSCLDDETTNLGFVFLSGA